MQRRVVMIADSLGGGLGAAVASASEWFTARGWPVTVAAPAADRTGQRVPGELVALDVPGSARDLVAMRRLGRQVRHLVSEREPAVVHCHGMRCFAATRVLGRVPAYVTLHWVGTSSTDPPGYRWVREAGMRAVARLATTAFSAAPGAPGRWVFTPHASPRLEAIGRCPPAPSDAPFLWLGRLDDPKRPDHFVEAVARAARSAPVRGWVAGTGPLEPRLREQIARLGAPVELLGHRDDVAELIRQARGVVLLSAGEAVTFALQEAMWSARPVIASDLPGSRWLAGDRRAGWGVTVADDPDEVAAAMRRLADPAVAASEGERAADRIRSLIEPDSPWPLVEEAYRAG